MDKWRYHIALAVANILFGISFSVYVSLLQGALHFEQLFALQLLFSTLIFTPKALFKGDFFRLTLNDFGSIFIVAILVVFGWWYLLIMGASYTNPIDASTIATLGPILTLIVAIISESRQATRNEIIGITIALSGAIAILIDRGKILVGEGGEGYGNALILCAVGAIAANTVLIAPALRNHGTGKVMGWYYLVGTILALPLLVEELPRIDVSKLPDIDSIEIAYILLFGSTLPMYLLYVGSEHLTSTHTAIYRYLQPITATSLAIIRGQSDIDRVNLIGAALVFLGILYIVVTTPAKSSPHFSRQRR